MPKKGQQVNIHIVTQPGEELEFYVKDHLLGKELFDLVCRAIGLRESYYFGLHYQRLKKQPCWLKMDKKIRHELGEDISKVKLYLRVEFFPEDVEEGLVLWQTQHLFFLHVKNEILNELIYCPAEEAVLMASYAVQAKFGDYDQDIHKKGFLGDEQLLPKRVTSLYQLTDEQWEERIVGWYAEHCHGLSRAEAEMEYLKIAQDLEMYGTNYYKIQNDKTTNLLLGILANGINIYEAENKLTPLCAFMWSEIKNISFKNKRIWIQPMEKSVDSFNFISLDVNINREILLLCSGNHELYMKRRRSDNLETQIMKSQANELKTERQKEINRFIKEKKLRIEASESQMDMEMRLQEYQSTLETYRQHLEKAEETTDLLAEKALVAEEESRLLIKKAADLEYEIKRLHMSCTEKEKEKVYLESHIQNAGVTIQQILKESEIRARETLLLKQELDHSRTSEKQATEKLLQITTNPRLVQRGVPHHLSSQVQQQHGHQPQYGGQPAIVNGEGGTSEYIKSLQQEGDEYLKKSHHLQQQLTDIKTAIDGLKIMDGGDIMDRLHIENVGKGENKYSTLQKIQAASTNARVQVYQQL